MTLNDIKFAKCNEIFYCKSDKEYKLCTDVMYINISIVDSISISKDLLNIEGVDRQSYIIRNNSGLIMVVSNSLDIAINNLKIQEV